MPKSKQKQDSQQRNAAFSLLQLNRSEATYSAPAPQIYKVAAQEPAAEAANAKAKIYKRTSTTDNPANKKNKMTASTRALTLEIYALLNHFKVDSSTAYVQSHENKRVIWILNYGYLNSVNCFLNMDQTTLIYPHGWKTAFMHKKSAHIAELQLFYDMPRFQISKFVDNTITTVGPWSDTPGKAFSEFNKLEGTDARVDNPTLFFGLSNAETQLRILEYFTSKAATTINLNNPAIKLLWEEHKLRASSAAETTNTQEEESDHSMEAISPLLFNDPTTPRAQSPQTLVCTSSSSSSAKAASKKSKKKESASTSYPLEEADYIQVYSESDNKWLDATVLEISADAAFIIYDNGIYSNLDLKTMRFKHISKIAPMNSLTFLHNGTEYFIPENTQGPQERSVLIKTKNIPN